MTQIWMHTRGRRACGNRIDLRYTRQPEGHPVVQGDGTFAVPDACPEDVVKLLVSQGHVKTDKKPVGITYPPKVTGGTWPDLLTNVKGVGAKTAQSIGKVFKSPAAFLAADGPPTGLDLSRSQWDKIEKYLNSRKNKE